MLNGNTCNNFCTIFYCDKDSLSLGRCRHHIPPSRCENTIHFEKAGIYTEGLTNATIKRFDSEMVEWGGLWLTIVNIFLGVKKIPN